MNTNCLEHTACPQCGNDSALKIAAKTLAHVTDDGAETLATWSGTTRALRHALHAAEKGSWGISPPLP